MKNDKQMNVVSFDRSKYKPDPARVAEFSAAARRLMRDRSSGDVIASLLRETPREEWSQLAERAELRNSGVLERLSRNVAAALEKEPSDALAMSNLATAIAETLPPENYPAVVIAQLRAHAWKDRAQSLSYVGRDQEALEAIERAESLLISFAAVSHDRAIVQLVKAIVLQHLKEWDGSLALLRECRRVFNDHKDTKRLLHCGLTEAMLLHRRAEYEKARAVLVPLCTVARDARDLDSLGAVHNNLALCLLELGELTEANIHFSEAVRHLNDAGRWIEAARADMNIGKLFVRRNDSEHAMEHLSKAQDVFQNNAMPEETGSCGALMMEAMLVRGNDSHARTIAQELARQLTGSRVSKQAFEAIAYAESAIATHDSALTAVRHVYDFFESLQTDPERVFAVP